MAVESGKQNCGKLRVRLFSPRPVKNLYFSTIYLWKKNDCLPKQKATFPHKNPLLLPLLPFIIYLYIYFILFSEKECIQCVLPVKKAY